MADKWGVSHRKTGADGLSRAKRHDDYRHSLRRVGVCVEKGHVRRCSCPKTERADIGVGSEFESVEAGVGTEAGFGAEPGEFPMTGMESQSESEPDLPRSTVQIEDVSEPESDDDRRRRMPALPRRFITESDESRVRRLIAGVPKVTIPRSVFMPEPKEARVRRLIAGVPKVTIPRRFVEGDPMLEYRPPVRFTNVNNFKSQIRVALTDALTDAIAGIRNYVGSTAVRKGKRYQRALALKIREIIETILSDVSVATTLRELRSALWIPRHDLDKLITETFPDDDVPWWMVAVRYILEEYYEALASAPDQS